MASTRNPKYSLSVKAVRWFRYRQSVVDRIVVSINQNKFI